MQKIIQWSPLKITGKRNYAAPIPLRADSVPQDRTKPKRWHREAEKILQNTSRGKAHVGRSALYVSETRLGQLL